jgi:sterol desaturase/sphingolipid hydroxylase (fatty acid hydroxylase superfamily)
MKRRLDLTAAQTAQLVGLGAAMVCGGYVLLALIPPHTHPILPIIVSLVLFALGFFISIRSQSDLKEGVANQRWEPSQIEPLRNLFLSAWWTALIIGLAVVAVVFMLIVWPHNTGIAWIFLYPSMTASWLAIAVRRTETPKPPIDWSNFGPIRSDHWGQR